MRGVKAAGVLDTGVLSLQTHVDRIFTLDAKAFFKQMLLTSDHASAAAASSGPDSAASTVLWPPSTSASQTPPWPGQVAQWCGVRE